MCNLYTLKAERWEIDAHFRAAQEWRERVQDTPFEAPNYAEEVYPGYTGLVFADSGLRAMTWGFPRKAVSKRTGKPIKPTATNNARDDQLLNPRGMWLYSFEERRCLMPMTAYAEAEGPDGHCTRTWISVPDSPVFACAAIWKHSEEWGEVYSMVTTRPPPSTEAVHDRAPLILRPEDYRQWLYGSPEDALELCQPYGGAVTIDQTSEPWRKATI